jgi:electron transfer flavoprotein beta subunit
MDIAVLISGVADPKWPLPKDLSVASLQAHATQYAALSPFDEAALEIALALRDADPAVRITALVAADEGLARRVAGWRPDTIHRLELDAGARFDTGAVARALAQALHELAPTATLVLIGREFGDLDDGTVPAALSLLHDAPFIPLALGVKRGDNGLVALRQAANGLERVQLPTRAMLSASNDPGNRLRHPLMKNVMMAKKAVLPAWRAPALESARALQLQSVNAAETPVRSSACEWLEGSARQKAQALAQVLLEAAA